MDTINKTELNFLIKPVLLLGTLLILTAVLIIIGVNQVTSIVSKTNESKRNEILLSQKISILENVSRVISGDTTFLDVVIPSKAAVLYGLSQIKNQAAQNALLISNAKTGAPVPEKNGIFKTLISFDVEGQEASIYTFLSSFSKVLPLMSVEKVKISTSGSIARATTTLSVYSAELPKTIPSVSTVAVDLSADELSLLKELTTYTLPVFIEPEAQEVSTKQDPFN